MVKGEDPSWILLTKKLLIDSPRLTFVHPEYPFFLQQELIEKTGRFFPRADMHFFDYVRQLLRLPLSYLCVGEATTEPGSLVVLLDYGGAPDISRISPMVGTLRQSDHSRYYQDHYRFMVEIDYENTHRINNLRTDIATLIGTVNHAGYRPGDPVRLIDNMRDEKPFPDDVDEEDRLDWIEGEDGLPKHFRERGWTRERYDDYKWSNAFYPADVGDEFTVLTVEDNRLFVTNPKGTDLYLPPGKVEKASHIDQGKTDEEIVRIRNYTIYNFFDRKGLFGKFEVVRQMMLYEARTGQKGLMHGWFEKTANKSEYNHVMEGFEVMNNVRRLPR